MPYLLLLCADCFLSRWCVVVQLAPIPKSAERVGIAFHVPTVRHDFRAASVGGIPEKGLSPSPG